MLDGSYKINAMKIKYSQNDFLSLINALLVGSIVYFLLFRCLNLTPDLINKHSWGESQYAMWARSYINDGFMFGVNEVDYFRPFVNYIPIASFIAAEISQLFDVNLVFTGRVISFLFSVLSVVYFNKLARIIFNDKFKAIVSTLIFVVLPINMYYSGMIYNDPLHLFFIVYLTYLLFFKRSDGYVRFYYSYVVLLTMLILLTKPTTVIIYGLPMLFIYYREWKSGAFDKKEFICIASVFFIVVIFFVVARMIYPLGYLQEGTKIINHAVWSDFGVYFKRAWSQLSSHFQHYYYVYIAGLPIALFSTTRIRFFFFMSLGFFIFYLMFIRGALVHQYYSLPFVVPFSIIAAYGMFTYTEILTKNKILFSLIVTVLLVVFSPSKNYLYYMFKPEYSRDIMYVVDTVKKVNGDKKIFMSGHGHKIFQYYLNIPYSNVKRRWSSNDSIALILEQKKINTLIVSNHSESSVMDDEVQNIGFRKLYCSDDYLIYVRGLDASESSMCRVKI